MERFRGVAGQARLRGTIQGMAGDHTSWSEETMPAALDRFFVQISLTGMPMSGMFAAGTFA